MIRLRILAGAPSRPMISSRSAATWSKPVGLKPRQSDQKLLTALAPHGCPFFGGPSARAPGIPSRFSTPDKVTRLKKRSVAVCDVARIPSGAQRLRAAIGRTRRLGADLDYSGAGGLEMDQENTETRQSQPYPSSGLTDPPSSFETSAASALDRHRAGYEERLGHLRGCRRFEAELRCSRHIDAVRLDAEMNADVIPVFHEHLRALNLSHEDDRIDLFLHTDGGDGMVPVAAHDLAPRVRQECLRTGPSPMLFRGDTDRARG